MMAAMYLKSPELMIEKTEADALAASIAEVEKFYSVTISPETRAWLGLAATAAMIYGPRAYNIYKRRKEENKGPKLAAPKPAQPSAPPQQSGSSAAPPPQEPGEFDPAGPPPTTMSMSDFGL